MSEWMRRIFVNGVGNERTFSAAQLQAGRNKNVFKGEDTFAI